MPENRDQKDVLPKKDNVTSSDRGLQQWGDEGMGEGEAVGTAGSGTAARQARIARGQEAQAREGEAARDARAKQRAADEE